MADQLRHAILGAGGICGLMGACLARSGDSVTLVGRRESLAQYPRRLRLDSAFGNVDIDVFIAAEVAPVDGLWITVKATEVVPALAAITDAAWVGMIVPLLSGIDHFPLFLPRSGGKKVIPATI